MWKNDRSAYPSIFFLKFCNAHKWAENQGQDMDIYANMTANLSHINEYRFFIKRSSMHS